MRKEWQNHNGTPCWGEDYASATQVEELTAEQIKEVEITGIGLTEDRSHVVCWYVMPDHTVIYIVGKEPAKVFARMADTGETLDDIEADKSGRLYAVGYKTPGPIINHGKIVEEAQSVHVPASMTGSTIWTGSGYVHDPDR